jgi:hypothetical protein
MSSRSAVWIALFAMLMVFAGPLISQSTPMAHSMNMGAMAMGDMAMPMHHDHGAKPPNRLDSQPGNGDLHPLWEKCGYCNLMLHCPALPQTLSVLTAAATPLARAEHYFTRAGHARQAIFPGALTRAPPLPLLA